MNETVDKIKALTESQQEALLFHAFGGDGNLAATQKDYRHLCKSGLLVRRDVSKSTSLGKFSTWEYEVPLDVHIALCEWCDQEIEEVKE